MKPDSDAFVWRSILGRFLLPGLSNCLASPGDLFAGGTRTLSVLSKEGARRTLMPGTSLLGCDVETGCRGYERCIVPSEASACPDTMARVPNCEEVSCDNRMSTLSEGAGAHGFGRGGAFVVASSDRVSIYSNYGLCLVKSWRRDGGTRPLDAGCAWVLNLGIVAVVAHENGAVVYIVPDAEESGEDALHNADFGTVECPMPETIPGTAGHSCIAADVSHTGHIAVATIYGRLAIWKLDLELPVRNPLTFVDYKVVNPPTSVSIADRITQILFGSPRRFEGSQDEADVSQRPSKLSLSVAWWSGRVDVFLSDTSWSEPVTFRLGGSSTDGLGSTPGTFLSYGESDRFLAASVAFGVLHFIDTEKRIMAFKYDMVARSDELREKLDGLSLSGAKPQLEVKGFAFDGRRLVVAARSLSELLYVDFPSVDRLNQYAVARLERKQLMDVSLRRRAMRGQSLVVFENSSVSLTAKESHGRFEHRVSGTDIAVRVPFPLGATSVDVLRLRDYAHTDKTRKHSTKECLVLCSVTASTSMFTLCMGRFVFAYCTENNVWSKKICPFNVQACCMFQSALETPGYQKTVACSSENGDIWLWAPGREGVLVPSLGPGASLQGMSGCFNTPDHCVAISCDTPSDERIGGIFLFDWTDVQNVQVRRYTLMRETLPRCDDHQIELLEIGGAWLKDNLLVVILFIPRTVMYTVTLRANPDQPLHRPRVSRIDLKSPRVQSVGKATREAGIPEKFFQKVAAP